MVVVVVGAAFVSRRRLRLGLGWQKCGACIHACTAITRKLRIVSEAGWEGGIPYSRLPTDERESEIEIEIELGCARLLFFF